MLNIDYFISRLEELMETNQLSAAAFAEKIGVQRSSVSHILSKRNKPSLEFILKIHAAFEDAGLDWLLLENSKQPTPPLSKVSVQENITVHEDPIEKTSPIDESASTTGQEVVQIIQLYQDGSFSTFFPKS
ncbi:helix-turn-helix transcriptional regulator [Flavobacteriaceae bacterium]|jgi:transcriptional regulator with XRE-family HTH domain|nr:helix-turn-helix transcriptional regulator [Flavobacteriaceae bacterium]MDC0917325.1 helix-turn-helix transcriptional regulator [Flavobacteriaceae bacterium]MDC3329682.1 helix-turn-helix transcriptional regulator [Flavobacteriaceae bacterium]